MATKRKRNKPRRGAQPSAPSRNARVRELPIEAAPSVSSAPFVEDWRRVLKGFTELLPLESKADRRQVRRLMQALDGEALEVFRIARRLETPFMIPMKFDDLRARYGRTEVHKRLSRSFTGTQVKLARLDKLDERVGQLHTDWYRQGGVILDRVEALRVSVELYEDLLTRTPRNTSGRGRSVAWRSRCT